MTIPAVYYQPLFDICSARHMQFVYLSAVFAS